MKYYFKYQVTCKDRSGKTQIVKLRADNPKHLIERFKEKYPSRTITKYVACEDS